MEQIDIEYKLYQILLGTHYLSYQGQEYKSVPNTLEDKYRAMQCYYDIIDDIKYDAIMSWDQALKLSERLGFWTSKDEEGLKGLEKMLENLKLDLFKSYIAPDKVKNIKKQLIQVRNGINRSNNNKFTLYHATKEFYASNIKRQLLLALSIRDSKNEKVFNNIKDFWFSDNIIVNLMSDVINKNYISQEEIRKISRSEPWRSMWIINHEKCFSLAPSEWTDEQRILASYSKMYDNVYESPDCPVDTIIEDDDMLDGWFIHQKREREKKNKSNTVDKALGKKGKDGQEVFLVAGSQDQAKEIYNMNDEGTRSIIKAREQVIKSSTEEVEHGHLPDVQSELRMQATRQFQQMMRR